MNADKLLGLVDRKMVTDLATEMVNTASPTGEEGEMARLLARMFKEVGLVPQLQNIYDDRYNAIGRLRGSGGGPAILMSGHMDTSVRGDEDYLTGKGWKNHAVVDGGRIYGNGVMNMKNAFVSYIAGVHALQRAGMKLKGDLIIAGTAGEVEMAPVDEFQGKHYHGYGMGTRFMLIHGVSADYHFLGEPTGQTPSTGLMGTTWAKVTTQGDFSHTAFSDTSLSAIDEMWLLWRELTPWIDEYKKRNVHMGVIPAVNRAALRGGLPWRAARTPNQCSLYIDIRFPPTRFPIDVEREFTEAIKVRNEALEVHRTLGDRRKQADALRALSWLLWSASRPDDAERAALDAVDVLAPLAPGREVALAYCALSDLALYVGDIEREVVWATRALKVARRVDDSSALLHARANLSAAAFLAEAEGGADELERSLEAAREAGLEELAASAFCVLAFGTTHFRAHSRARSYIARGIDYCTERDLDGWRPYLVAMRAQVELAEGRWDAAAASAMLVLAGVEPERLTGHGFGPSTAIALAVLGRVRARRGDPGQWTALDEALTVAAPSREPMRLAPVAAGRAEAAWLEGRPELVAEATEAVFDLLRLRQRWDPWWGGELASWRARGGIEDRELPDVAEPYAAAPRP